MKDKDGRKRKARVVFDGILKELFPEDYVCDVCGGESFEGNICRSCTDKVFYNSGSTCPVCGRKTFRPEICMECKSKPPFYEKAVSPFVYTDGVAELISKFKNNKPYLKRFFLAAVSQKLIGFPEVDAIVYVPLSKYSLVKRGYNQSYILAKSIAKLTRTPVLKGEIIRVRRTRVQKGLTRKEREENVKGAFKIRNREPVKNKKILIVDDVLTTGATADEISRILIKAGAAKVYVVTVASVEYLSATQKQAQKDKKSGNGN